MNTTRFLGMVFAGTAVTLLCLPLWAQSPPAPSAERDGCLITVNGRPTALTWALGLSDPEDIPTYLQTGLNTVYLRVTDGSAEQLDRLSRFATAAEDQGLMAVVALAPRMLVSPEGSDLPPDPTSDAYREAVQSFIDAAIPGFGQHPRLLAWVIELLPREVVNDDDNFLTYLEEWYPNIDALNDSWGTEYESWDDIVLDTIRDVDTDRPAGVGRASLDYAAYRQQVYADTLTLWANALRAADPPRLVLVSALTDYRSIISVPDSVDGMVTLTLPAITEDDWDTHNVHAVDIARQDNRFAAIQTLTTGESTSPEDLHAWASLALVHGAAGLAFTSWPAIRDRAELRAAVGAIRDSLQQQSFPRQPAAQAAILYEPYAGGMNGPEGSLYGYLEGFTPGSPTNLFSACRYGTRYGLLDVISADALTGRDLPEYRVIIAPMAFYLTMEQQLALQRFVARGGVLVADAGLGMYQADGTIDSMPSIMREVLGLRYEDLAQLTAEPEPEGVQHYQAGDIRRDDDTERTEDPQERVRRGLLRYVQQIEEFVSREEVAKHFDVTFMGALGQGARVHPSGEGLTIYLPDFLYADWDVTDPFFNEFHDRLLAFGSTLEITDPDATWPRVSLSRYDDNSLGIASGDGSPVALLVYDGNNQLRFVPSGATRVSNPEEDTAIECLTPGGPLARLAPLPIYVYPEGEGATAAVTVLRYGRDGIELSVSGTGNTDSVVGGRVQLTAGLPTSMTIEIRPGAYALGAASIHRVTVEQTGARRGNNRQDLMPDTDTGALVIPGVFAGARVTISPAPKE